MFGTLSMQIQTAYHRTTPVLLQKGVPYFLAKIEAYRTDILVYNKLLLLFVSQKRLK